MERFIPEQIQESSLAGRTLLVIVGAVLLAVPSLVRPENPLLIVVPFILGVLIEWFVVASVYLNVKQLENEILGAWDDIEERYDEINDLEKRLDRDVFGTARHERSSVAKRVENIENRVDKLSREMDNVQRKVSDVEREIGRLKDSFR